MNLRDCETSLKQIDVYALGLVLWELASRCSDFYPNGIECGLYRLPFEAEIGEFFNYIMYLIEQKDNKYIVSTTNQKSSIQIRCKLWLELNNEN